MATRAAIYGQFNATRKANMNYSFPVKNARVTRKSNANATHHNYGVTRQVCALFADHGIDGYYIGASETFHSEIAICGRALREGVLTQISRETVASVNVKQQRKAAPKTMSRFAMANDSENEEGTLLFPPSILRTTRRR